MKNRLALFAILAVTISLLSVQEVNAQTFAGDYDWKSNKYVSFDDTPYVCIVRSQSNTGLYDKWVGAVYLGAIEWQTKLHATVITEEQRALWNIRVIILDEEKSYCNITTVIRPPTTDPYYGEANYDNIWIYIRSSSDWDQVKNTMSHELGHSFGLGHYFACDDCTKENFSKQDRAWGSYVHSPSIMIPYHHWDDRMTGITDLDIKTIKEMYGVDGFKPPVIIQPKIDPVYPTTPKQERTSDRVGGVNIYSRTATITEGGTISIAGQVLNDYQKPMSNVLVIVSDKKYPCNYNIPSSGYGYTYDNGNFDITLTPKAIEGYSRTQINLVACVEIPYGEVVSNQFRLFIDSPKIVIPKKIETYQKIETAQETQYNLQVESEKIANAAQIDELKTLREKAVKTTKKIESKAFTAEESLKGISYEKAEAQKKINQAWDLMKMTNSKIADVNHGILIGDQRLEQLEINFAKDPRSRDQLTENYYTLDPKFLESVDTNLVRISHLIQEAEKLDQQTCFLFWCS